ncbi:hypothetical protein HXX25_03870 [Hyphobacterium sp. CCMP332]|uniref:hypothetical protein n=1 Tax=Hyphobacterium sp. CCMP332 TaxID=2749086 RepID=UPI00164FC46D|nr:hypothetical protein [Hyphobacterium sp. CCMP332]QNL18551.1 hypothetical protein HXX25_03870 [Hyphobacterium sp. CCMP332]
MKHLVSLRTLTVVIAASPANARAQTPDNTFAEQTRQAVLSRDYAFFGDRFSDVESFAVEPASDTVDSDGVAVTGFSASVADWIYEGGPDRRSAEAILSSPDLRMELLENWIQSENPDEVVHLIIYYTGEFEDIDWVADYMQRFCVTEVSLEAGQWRFRHSLFRSESGHPFVGDYG